ncbi:hypothetical protein ABZ498_06560 [Streptomyces lavendulocolor]|uniref:hypothetical protein n=1 Tax=Streptomyces lavendulocolor TaxID=67316 RepID=UPI0033DD4939
MITDEVSQELDNLGVTSTAPGLAAIALNLARTLDEIPPGDSPTSQAAVARELAALLVRLRAMSGTSGKGGARDELMRRREERLKQQRQRAAGDA